MGAEDQRIFVQVAAFRDQELLPTLRNCVAQADQPDQLRFGICWQHDGTESLKEFADAKNVRVHEVPHELSRGACWARSKTQGLYQSEPYTLQIDSHHRFASGWDTVLKRLLLDAQETGSPKPLLTSYAPHYDPEGDESSRGKAPLRLCFDRFSDDGPLQLVPVEIPVAQQGVGLEPARFLSAHFLFTLGEFCREVPYDPKLYFFGEEPSLALRAYTHGYDLFHPLQIVLWHHYGREGAPRHWSENPRWSLRNELSLQRYRYLVTGTQQSVLGEFGCGSQRSLADYEQFAGLSLSGVYVSEQARRGDPPAKPRISFWRRIRGQK